MTIQLKDKVEQFKRDCKSVHYYQKVIQECEEHIAHYDQILSDTGQRLINYKKDNLNEVILEQTLFMGEKEKYQKRLDEIISKINNIDDSNDKNMLYDLFVFQKYYKSLVLKYHFNDTSALYRHINKVIEKIV